MPERFRLLGLPIDLVTEPELTRFVCNRAGRHAGIVVGNVNMNALVLARRQPHMQRFLKESEIVHVDGMPVVWMARLAGIPIRTKHRVTYLDWIDPLMAAAATEQLRVFFLGGRPGVARRAADIVAERNPGIEIRSHHGYFNLDPGSSENEEVIRKVRGFDPHILLVGLGMPLQEGWIQMNRDRVGAGAYLAAGAIMDYMVGVARTPPRWTGRAGLEWAYRLAVEPGRLSRRYLIEPWVLVSPYLRELWQMRLLRNPPTAEQRTDLHR